MLDTSVVWNGREVSLELQTELDSSHAVGYLVIDEKYKFRTDFSIFKDRCSNWSWGTAWYEMCEEDATFLNKGHTGLLRPVYHGLRLFAQQAIPICKPYGVILVGSDQKRCDWNVVHMRDLNIVGYGLQAYWTEKKSRGLCWAKDIRKDTRKWSINRAEYWTVLEQPYVKPKVLEYV